MVLRLKKIRKAVGLTQKDFAKNLGITQTAYSMIETGKRPLAEPYIKVICSVFNVNENWLLTGEGEIFFSHPYEKELAKKYSQLDPELQEFLSRMTDELLILQQKFLHDPERNDTA